MQLTSNYFSNLPSQRAAAGCSQRCRGQLLVHQRLLAPHGQPAPLRRLPLASSSQEPPSSSEANPQPMVPEGTKLTTWQYAKLSDPGFGPWFVAMAFLPFLLLLVPLLSSPPMPSQ